MKTILISFLFLTSFAMQNSNAQTEETSTGDNFGNTLNLGVGIGYYGYVGYSMPIIHADYELNVAKNFTLAPFITAYQYKKYQRWGNANNEYRDYYYQVTVIPVGVKGTWYFDQFVHANSKWDFYLAASLGFAYRKTVWENGYGGDYYISRGSSGLYLDGHLGAEFHMTKKLGLFLDLSSGISTFGLAFHL